MYVYVESGNDLDIYYKYNDNGIRTEKKIVERVTLDETVILLLMFTLNIKKGDLMMLKKNRIKAILIDYIILLLILIFFYGVYLVLDLGHPVIGLWWLYIITIIYFLLKDLVFKNKSIGKKQYKLEVLSLKNENPSIFKLIIRNITILIWPIELLLIFINERKIGDILTGTKVSQIGNINLVYHQNPKKKIIIISIIIFVIFLLASIINMLMFYYI